MDKVVGAGLKLDGVEGLKPHDGVAFEMTNADEIRSFSGRWRDKGYFRERE